MSFSSDQFIESEYEDSNRGIKKKIDSFRENLLELDARMQALEKANYQLVQQIKSMKDTLRLVPRRVNKKYQKVEE